MEEIKSLKKIYTNTIKNVEGFPKSIKFEKKKRCLFIFFKKTIKTSCSQLVLIILKDNVLKKLYKQNSNLIYLYFLWFYF